MSYDIQLIDPVTRETLMLDEPHQMRGGTYAMGGTRELWLNVTYNYYPYFESMGEKGIRTLCGMTGAESLSLLDKAIAELSDDVVKDDYWEPTKGNAKQALLQLRALALLRPDGIWDGD